MASPKKKLVNLRLAPKTIKLMDDMCTRRTRTERRHIYRSELVTRLVDQAVSSSRAES